MQKSRQLNTQEIAHNTYGNSMKMQNVKNKKQTQHSFSNNTRKNTRKNTEEKPKAKYECIQNTNARGHTKHLRKNQSFVLQHTKQTWPVVSTLKIAQKLVINQIFEIFLKQNN